jgi:hypothetical protein
MRRSAYYRRAAKRFLAGTKFKAPFELVMAGHKSLEDWADVLALEREAEDQYDEERRTKRKNRHLAASPEQTRDLKVSFDLR